MLRDILLVGAVQVFVATDELLNGASVARSLSGKSVEKGTHLEEHILHHIIELEMLIPTPKGLDVVVERLRSGSVRCAIRRHDGRAVC